MTNRRLGLTALVAAALALSGCAMGSNLAARLGGGDPAGTPRGGSGPTPGSTMTTARDLSPSGMAQVPMPRFSSYAECRAWLLSPAASDVLGRAPWVNGEVTLASEDPCLQIGPRS